MQNAARKIDFRLYINITALPLRFDADFGSDFDTDLAADAPGGKWGNRPIYGFAPL